ncbi:hypothetical protein MLD38_018436 [Melastoma candidum]|uniref:Uncharacterized protein n=1 Tax=Melastoma candidum TaxID=119954 RepID=A0ACB9QU05_9MYRT|nr:hypothetical protein MLD38_018436 [Melastoma candidum]
MLQVSRVAVQFNITCSADKFYGIFRKNMGLLVQLFPEYVKGYKFVKGNEFGNGAVVIWNYDLGSPATMKGRHDSNDATRTITLTVLGGDVLDKYKSFVAKLQVDPGVTKWSIEFEKISPNTPNPNEFL